MSFRTILLRIRLHFLSGWGVWHDPGSVVSHADFSNNPSLVSKRNNPARLRFPVLGPVEHLEAIQHRLCRADYILRRNRLLKYPGIVALRQYVAGAWIEAEHTNCCPVVNERDFEIELAPWRTHRPGSAEGQVGLCPPSRLHRQCGLADIHVHSWPWRGRWSRGCPRCGRGYRRSTRCWRRRSGNTDCSPDQGWSSRGHRSCCWRHILRVRG